MYKLFIFCGIPFSGKSFIAKKIAQQFNYHIVDFDEVKFAIFGKDIKDENIDQNGWNKVFRETYKQIENLLKKGARLFMIWETLQNMREVWQKGLRINLT